MSISSPLRLKINNTFLFLTTSFHLKRPSKVPPTPSNSILISPGFSQFFTSYTTSDRPKHTPKLCPIEWQQSGNHLLWYSHPHIILYNRSMCGRPTSNPAIHALPESIIFTSNGAIRSLPPTLDYRDNIIPPLMRISILLMIESLNVI